MPVAKTISSLCGCPALTLLLFLGLSEAHAEVRLSTDGAMVRIEAQAARVSEVLSALQTKFKLRYRIAMGVDDTIDGTFSGPVEQVVGRALAKLNYVVKRENDGLEVVVLGRRGDHAVVAPSPPAGDRPADAWRSKPVQTAPAR
jgi:hypothetical protein